MRDTQQEDNQNEAPTLSREQIYTLLEMRAQAGIFTTLPRDLLRHTLVNAGDASYDPNSDIAKLLHHIIYGAKEDLVEIRRILVMLCTT